MSETVSIHKFLGHCSVKCQAIFGYLVTYQKLNSIYNFYTMDSCSLKHLIKETEYKAKEYRKLLARVPTPDRII